MRAVQVLMLAGLTWAAAVQGKAPRRTASPTAAPLDAAANCERVFKGEVRRLQVANRAVTPPQRGLAADFCRVMVGQTIALIGLESVDPRVPTIAATWLKTAKPINTTRFPFDGVGNPAFKFCTGFGGVQAGVVGRLSFADADGESDMCVFGDGSRASAWTIAYTGWAFAKGADKSFQRIRNAVSAAQVLKGISPPGDMF
jgi:hypothetical protein